MRWSVLDQSPHSEGSTQDAAIRDSLALAQHCDALGYTRYWVSEHHNSASIVGTAPEILMAAVAATTRRIRIGSAGVMLPHYSALKVAEQLLWPALVLHVTGVTPLLPTVSVGVPVGAVWPP